MHLYLPAALLALYTLGFIFFLGLSRRKAILGREVDYRYYQLYQGHEEPPEMRVRTRHVANLFETPILFYAAVVMIQSAGLSSPFFIGLAWLYVALRLVHAAVHLGGNVVLYRFLSFALSLLVLVVMWAGLAVQIARGAG